MYSLEYKEFNIFVVDNRSDNHSISRIRDWVESEGKPNILISSLGDIPSGVGVTYLIQSEENSGYSAGNNIGIKAAIRAGSEYIWILNPDTVADPASLTHLVGWIDSDDRIGLVGPRIERDNGVVQRTCAKKRPMVSDYFVGKFLWRRIVSKEVLNPIYYEEELYAASSPQMIDIISGASMLIRSSILEEIEFLNENTFLYMEELILHEKLRASGYLTYYHPSSVVRHTGPNETANVSSRFVEKAYLESLFYYWRNIRKERFVVCIFIQINVRILRFLSRIRKT